MRKIALILLGIVFLLGCVETKNLPEDYDEKLSLGIAALGLEANNVEVEGTKVIVKYVQPPTKSDIDIIMAWQAIFAMAATLDDNVEYIEIHTYQNGTEILKGGVNASYVRKFLNNEISVENFTKKVSVVNLTVI